MGQAAHSPLTPGDHINNRRSCPLPVLLGEGRDIARKRDTGYLGPSGSTGTLETIRTSASLQER